MGYKGILTLILQDCSPKLSGKYLYSPFIYVEYHMNFYVTYL